MTSLFVHVPNRGLRDPSLPRPLLEFTQTIQKTQRCELRRLQVLQIGFHRHRHYYRFPACDSPPSSHASDNRSALLRANRQKACNPPARIFSKFLAIQSRQAMTAFGVNVTAGSDS